MFNTYAEMKVKQIGDRIKSVLLVGYLKGTYGWYFYDPREQKGVC